jgi:protein TonB
VEKTLNSIDRLWSELMNTPPPPQSEWVDPAASSKPVAPAPSAPRTPAVAVIESPKVATPAAPQLAPPPPPPQLVPPTPPTLLPATTVSPPNRTDGVHVEPARNEPVRKNAPKAPPNDWRAKTIPKPAKPINQLALPMAALVLVAFGLGGYWVRTHGGLSAVLEGETAEAAGKPERARQSAPRAAEPAKPAGAERAVRPARQPEKPRAAQPRAAAPKAAAATPKPRPVSAPAREPLPAAAVAVPAVATLPVEVPAVAASTVVASAAPQGPFFEPTDVQEAPRVASRVDPDVPEDLRSRVRNEIVIVRMLVSQSGQPSRVSLLRKSKTGSRVDEAVLAAVSQWKFSPAKRRGEAVSSWFNIGVPLAH